MGDDVTAVRRTQAQGPVMTVSLLLVMADAMEGLWPEK